MCYLFRQQTDYLGHNRPYIQDLYYSNSEMFNPQYAIISRGKTKQCCTVPLSLYKNIRTDWKSLTETFSQRGDVQVLSVPLYHTVKVYLAQRTAQHKPGSLRPATIFNPQNHQQLRHMVNLSGHLQPLLALVHLLKRSAGGEYRFQNIRMMLQGQNKGLLQTSWTRKE